MTLAVQLKSDPRNALGLFRDRLTTAHSRIETVFLEGGETLVSVMELVQGMIGTLDRISKTLDKDDGPDTISGMNRAISDLGSLPSAASARQQSFIDIAAACGGAIVHVGDMRETFRYLKVFATTVKITGAGLAEFAEFAEEIRSRIMSGAEEIDRFSTELDHMRKELESARNLSGGIIAEFGTTVPALAANLSKNAVRMKAEYDAMARLAREVKTVAGDVQAKIAQTLSALQIGDITRQRIEHMQTSFDLLDRFLDEEEGRALTAGERANLSAAVTHLVDAQIEQTLADFREKCARISATISSFSADAARILALRADLSASRSGEDGGTLAQMERDLAAALDLTQRVDERSSESTRLAQSVAGSVRALIASIETIRSIKIDIHYMALNSNLRCSRLGDEGRSVNVVSAELRTFAGRLEEPADAVVASMHNISEAADNLAVVRSGALSSLAGPLETTRLAIGEAATAIDECFQALDEQGNAVFGRISAAVRSLDFERELGSALAACSDLSAEMAGNAPCEPCGAYAEVLGSRIHAIYTMIEEREIHLRFLPGPPAADAPAGAPASHSDDDFLDDALF
ncbi:Methyl-accepting chemotaxis protein [Rhizobium sp. RU20A]|uniref:chemotaxis protein n=1 Tax=Rhizobium sp. RU20A TaxID=1907412 RepID=UPI000955A5FF|nr:chemotaxis protein [Rhizobium sp. RU20A]SIR32369.1 Methyl-accepting chemotaxis protein [Rhizobium sp. RU20A]